MKSRLRFRDKFYGREAQLQQLEKAYLEATQNTSQLVLVTGYAGVGKSRLVEKFREVVRNRYYRSPPYFVTSKSDDSGSQTQPYVLLARAFSLLLEQIMDHRDAAWLDGFRRHVQEEVGDEAQLITNLIPGLERFLGHKTEDPMKVVNLDASFHRLSFVFQQFARVVCSHHGRPVVMFLDDLQWADAGSLQLLRMIATDAQSKNLLLIGAYRDYEITESHVLRSFLDTVQVPDRGLSDPVVVEVKDMVLADVRRMLAEVLDKDENDVDLLAYVLFEKTNGNALYTIMTMQLLESLGIMKYSHMTQTWSWCLDEVHDRIGISDNVVDLVLVKIDALSQQEKGVLATASYLRSTIDSPLLSALLPMLGYECDGLKDVLDSLVELNLLERSSDGSLYSFPHDRVKEAASRLIPACDHESTSLIVGKYLLERHASLQTDEEDLEMSDCASDDQEAEWMLFAALDHLADLSLDILLDRIDMKLLLSASVRAADYCYARGSFGTASRHYKHAVSLLRLDDDRWDWNYELCVRAFLAASETLFFKGAFDDGHAILQEVLARARNEWDEIDAYCTLATACGQMNRNKEAVNLLVKVLRILGVAVPRSGVEMPLVVLEARRIRKRMTGIDAADVLSLPENRDPRILKILEVLSTLGVRADLCRRVELVAFATVRRVHLTLQHGLSSLAAPSFLGLHMMAASVFNMYEFADQLAAMALAIQKSRSGMKFECRMQFHLYW